MSSRAETTRDRLRGAARSLIAEQGYDATTVEQIAAAAGMSHMTFFRHFPTKDAVLLDDPFDPMMAALVADQPSDLGAWERTRRGLREACRRLDERSAPRREDLRLVAEHPRLRAGAWANTRRTESVLVEALTASGSGHEESVLAVGACIGALMAVLLDWAQTDAATSLGDRLVDALDAMARQPERTALS